MGIAFPYLDSVTVKIKKENRTIPLYSQIMTSWFYTMLMKLKLIHCLKIHTDFDIKNSLSTEKLLLQQLL